MLECNATSKRELMKGAIASLRVKLFSFSSNQHRHFQRHNSCPTIPRTGFIHYNRSPFQVPPQQIQSGCGWCRDNFSTRANNKVTHNSLLLLLTHRNTPIRIVVSPTQSYEKSHFHHAHIVEHYPYFSKWIWLLVVRFVASPD